MPKHRQDRVSDRIHREISGLLQTESKDPRLTSVTVTVTAVEVTADLKLATIFVSVMGDQQARKNALAGLEHATGYLRRELAQRLQMRLTPALRFVLDVSWERGARVDALLEQLQDSAPINRETTQQAGTDNFEQQIAG